MSREINREPVAVRHSFDGYGWEYTDDGSGSDWFRRAMMREDAEPLYLKSPAQNTLDADANASDIAHENEKLRRSLYEAKRRAEYAYVALGLTAILFLVAAISPGVSQ